MDEKTKETLEKQLQLLSERSEMANNSELIGLTHVMTEIADRLPKRFVPEYGGNFQVRENGIVVDCAGPNVKGRA